MPLERLHDPPDRKGVVKVDVIVQHDDQGAAGGFQGAVAGGGADVLRQRDQPDLRIVTPNIAGGFLPRAVVGHDYLEGGIVLQQRRVQNAGKSFTPAIAEYRDANGRGQTNLQSSGSGPAQAQFPCRDTLEGEVAPTVITAGGEQGQVPPHPH
jgi:hypothetical protein